MLRSVGLFFLCLLPLLSLDLVNESDGQRQVLLLDLLLVEVHHFVDEVIAFLVRSWIRGFLRID